MRKLPSVSIVVPNYNGGATIGKTLQSIVDQDYPALEIIAIDGGSTDNSVEVIRQFQSKLKYWESEKDRGQSHAINKGFSHCTGDIVNWLNSDDYLLPGALKTIGETFANHREADIVYGGCVMEWPHEGRSYIYHTPPLERVQLMPCCCPIAQPSCFFRRRLLDRTPVLDESNHFAMDFELWNYFIHKGATWFPIPDVLSAFPHSGENKSSTGGEKIIRDHERIYRQYVAEKIPLTYWYRRLCLPFIRFRKRHPGRGWRLVCRTMEKLYVAALSPFYGAERVRCMNWEPWA